MDRPFDEDDDGDDDDGALVAPTHPPDPNRMAALACQSLHLEKIKHQLKALWYDGVKYIPSYSG